VVELGGDPQRRDTTRGRENWTLDVPSETAGSSLIDAIRTVQNLVKVLSATLNLNGIQSKRREVGCHVTALEEVGDLGPCFSIIYREFGNKLPLLSYFQTR
jgi:hypothetical protein